MRYANGEVPMVGDVFTICSHWRVWKIDGERALVSLGQNIDLEPNDKDGNYITIDRNCHLKHRKDGSTIKKKEFIGLTNTEDLLL